MEYGGNPIMSRVCQVTGKRPATGNNVYGPFPQADETAGSIGYHEISAEIGPIYIGGVTSAKIELICW